MSDQTSTTTAAAGATGDGIRDAYRKVDDRINRALMEGAIAIEDPEHIARRPTYRGQVYPPVRARPITELRVAVRAQQILTGHVRRAASEARGGGASWAEIAHVLGIEHGRDYPDDTSSGARAEAAFYLVAGDLGWRAFDTRYVTWECGSCGQRVKDTGPFEACPKNTESGHSPGCRRYADELAAYEAAWADED